MSQSVYKRRFAEQARSMCLLGSTNEQLADFFNVTSNTIARWIRNKPDFRRAVFEGREGADVAVAEAMYKRATGFKKDLVKVFQHRGKGVKVPYTEYFPPDVAAGKFWLMSRQGWKERNETSGPGGSALIPEKITVEFVGGNTRSPSR